MPFRKIRRVIFRRFQIDTTLCHSESLVSNGVWQFGHSFNRTVVIQRLYQVEREVADLSPGERERIRQEQAKPILDEFHDWLSRHRLQVPNGSSTAKAIDYSLKRWKALVHYLDDGQVPIDNNWIENRIRPIATGRKNWLFAGSLRAGKRAAAIMSLIQSAKLNGHDPFLYLKDVLSRLPTQPNSRIGELLPHRWAPESAA